MYRIKTDFSKVLAWVVAFPDNYFAQHGKFKVGFGDAEDSVDNPTSVCVEYNSGDRLLEVADFSDGSSSMGATMGGDRNIVVATKPFAYAEDKDCHILGVLEYRQGSQPTLKVNGEPVTGGASRFSSFVSETGKAAEDPKPREVADDTQQESYFVNRETGHAAHRKYYVHIYRIGTTAGVAYPALTLENSGNTPKTDTVFPVPVTTGNFCSNCGQEL